MAETMGRPSWRVVAASVQGASHRERGLPCQDAHAVRVLADGTLLVAAADGAGSAARSEEGARLAVERAVAALTLGCEAPPRCHDVWRDALLDVYREARKALDAAATEAEVTVDQFATTLACVVVRDDLFVAAQVGDGAVVTEDATGALALALGPRRGEYANTTTFLTTRDACDHLDVVVATAPIRAVAVTTDGLLRLALNLRQQTPHPPFFRPLLAFAAEAEDADEARAQLSSFLASDRVAARTEDDTTLVLAVRALAPPAPQSWGETTVGRRPRSPRHTQRVPGTRHPGRGFLPLARARERGSGGEGSSGGVR